jgi:hypothetical protein
MSSNPLTNSLLSQRESLKIVGLNDWLPYLPEVSFLIKIIRPSLVLSLTREPCGMPIVEIHTKHIFRFRMYYFYEIFIPSLHFDPKMKSGGGR